MKKRRKRRYRNPFLDQYLNLISLCVFIVAVVAIILVSFFVLDIPLVPIACIVILEALMCAVLNPIPIWVHGLLVIAQVVAGVCCGKLIFMLLMIAIYILSIILIHIWTRGNKEQR